jgi:hypothetical protein
MLIVSVFLRFLIFASRYYIRIYCCVVLLDDCEISYARGANLDWECLSQL